jgi:hypothetical protein
MKQAIGMAPRRRKKLAKRKAKRKVARKKTVSRRKTKASSPAVGRKAVNRP